MKHEWFKCNLCGWSVVCSTCGNSCCNGTYGEIDGEPCPDCQDAYAYQASERDMPLDAYQTPCVKF